MRVFWTLLRFDRGLTRNARPGPFSRGERRISQVPGPSSSNAPWSSIPPDASPTSPVHGWRSCCLQG